MDTITLGLSFSTRMLGIAIFKENMLVDYFLKLHKAKWSVEKQEFILASLASCMAHYAITDVVILLPERHCQTDDFTKLRSSIESFLEQHNLSAVVYAVKEVYRAFGSPVRRTRNSLMKRIVILYPELEKYYAKELENKNKYYVKLFEAVAVAGYHWLQQYQQ